MRLQLKVLFEDHLQLCKEVGQSSISLVAELRYGQGILIFDSRVIPFIFCQQPQLNPVWFLV